MKHAKLSFFKSPCFGMLTLMAVDLDKPANIFVAP